MINNIPLKDMPGFINEAIEEIFRRASLPTSNREYLEIDSGTAKPYIKILDAGLTLLRDTNQPYHADKLDSSMKDLKTKIWLAFNEVVSFGPISGQDGIPVSCIDGVNWGWVNTRMNGRYVFVGPEDLNDALWPLAITPFEYNGFFWLVGHDQLDTNKRNPLWLSAIDYLNTGEFALMPMPPMNMPEGMIQAVHDSETTLDVIMSHKASGTMDSVFRDARTMVSLEPPDEIAKMSKLYADMRKDAKFASKLKAAIAELDESDMSKKTLRITTYEEKTVLVEIVSDINVYSFTIGKNPPFNVSKDDDSLVYKVVYEINQEIK